MKQSKIDRKIESLKLDFTVIAEDSYSLDRMLQNLQEALNTLRYRIKIMKKREADTRSVNANKRRRRQS